MKLKNNTHPKNGNIVLAQGFAKLVPMKSIHDMVYMISSLNRIKFINIIDHIRTTIVIRFQNDFFLFSVLYDATLCSRLFHNADGIMRKISINVSHSHHIPVYTNHSDVGKKFDKNIKTINV
jgi:hypothetical protein